MGFVKLHIYLFVCSLYRAPFTPCVSIHFLLRTPFTGPNAFADELVICSLNVRGLSNTMKRCEIFRWLKTKKYAIFFLQEVHCSKDKEICWTSELGYSAIFSSLSSAIAGVNMLFNNNFSFQILKTISDPKGLRFMIVDIKTESKTLTLANMCFVDQKGFVS